MASTSSTRKLPRHFFRLGYITKSGDPEYRREMEALLERLERRTPRADESGSEAPA